MHQKGTWVNNKIYMRSCNEKQNNIEQTKRPVLRDSMCTELHTTTQASNVAKEYIWCATGFTWKRLDNSDAQWPMKFACRGAQMSQKIPTTAQRQQNRTNHVHTKITHRHNTCNEKTVCVCVQNRVVLGTNSCAQNYQTVHQFSVGDRPPWGQPLFGDVWECETYHGSNHADLDLTQTCCAVYAQTWAFACTMVCMFCEM